MTDDRFSFEGLTAIESRLVRRADDIGYLVLQDRTVPRQDETLGRFDFETSDAVPYLPSELPADPGDPDAAFRLDDGDVPGFSLETHPPGEPLPLRVIAYCAARWVRGLASRNTVGDSFRRFRVKVYSPKGSSLIDSGQFVCRNHALDEHLPEDHAIAQLRIPDPDFEAAASAGAARGMRALGDYYAQWGQIVLGSVGQLQGIHNATTLQLHRQLHDTRGQVDTLVAAILEDRFRQASEEQDRATAERTTDARHDLAREAIAQIGDAAKVFVAARGINPELAEVANTLGQSQELMAVLNDPDVRELMKEPDNLKGLAFMLKQTADQARVMRENTATRGLTGGPRSDLESP